MNSAIVLAGGTGTRVGANVPKQYIDVLGKPIIVYTLEKLQNNSNIDRIVVVSHKDWIDYTKKLVKKYNITKVFDVIEGGNSFPDSTVKGLFFLKNIINDNDIVLVHGSCAPLVTDEVINDCIEKAKEKDAAMAAQDVHLSTCIKSNSEYSDKTIDRESIVMVQFPLAFRYGYIYDIYNRCINDGSFEKLGLHLQYAVFESGGKMYFSKSDPRNFKITTKEDIDLFEGYLLLEEKRKKYVK